MKFELGDEVKEIVTGYKGIVMGITQYITGCTQYGLQQRKLNKEGKMGDWLWLDEDRLKATGKSLTLKQKPTGGPQQTPPARS